MALSDEFLQQAKMLVKLDKNRPKQINLRRSTSAAYYAVFHELCLMSAVAIVGKKGALKRAWCQVYRASEHTNLEKKLRMQNGLFNEEQKQMWPLENISDTFSTLQLRRHDADYNPHHRFKQSEVLTYIASSESAIKSLRKLSEKDKKTLAVFLNFGQRKSNKFNA